MSSPSTPLRSLLEKFAAELENACADSRERGRRELADRLNQSVRRIRQAGDREELGETVADAAGAFASGAIWLRVEKGAARSEKWDLTIPLNSAAALAGAAETREPVVALAAPDEVSRELVERFAHTEQARALVFPIVAKEKAGALLYAWAETPGDAWNSALELLAQAASAAWLALEPPPPPLVSIAPASKPAPPWDALSADEQRIHLRAQRYARVQVSQLRLREAAAVQAGRASRNLYETLREPIDAARDDFRGEFFAQCPSMVDYLHLELARTLANDDADLLGKDYPGPMV